MLRSLGIHYSKLSKVRKEIKPESPEFDRILRLMDLCKADVRPNGGENKVYIWSNTVTGYGSTLIKAMSMFRDEVYGLSEHVY